MKLGSDEILLLAYRFCAITVSTQAIALSNIQNWEGIVITLSERSAMVCTLAFAFLITAGCGGGHDGCRPNPAVTADMATLNLPPPEGGKLCHAEAKFVMYEVQKDRAEVVNESTEKLKKAGWKEIPDPSGKSDDPSSLYFEKSGRQIWYHIAKCSRSSFADISGSCSVVTFDDVTK